MVKLTLAALAAAIAFMPTASEARHKTRHYKHHYRHERIYRVPVNTFLADKRGEVVSHPPGCPSRAFCGCGVALKVFGSHRRDLWLARAWYRFPRSQPGPGAVAVWPHHVVYILESLGNSIARVYDPNSGGHKTRIHVRSLARATIVNPTG